MTQYVKIKKGHWRGNLIQGLHKVLKPFKTSPSGDFITVEFDDGTAGRVKCKFKDIELTGEPDATQRDPRVEEPTTITMSSAEEFVRANETERQANARIESSFEKLKVITQSAISGSIRGAIVSGPPGVGKSYGVLEELVKAEFPRRVVGEPSVYHVVKGMATPIALYKILWTYRSKRSVVVFDDCDSIFHDDVSLNLLKAALDSSKRRRIGWNAESRILKEDDIPNDFDFEGSVIFLTNLDFDHQKSKRLEPHLHALKSRCHYLDLTIGNQNDIIRRIRQLQRKGELLKDYDLGADMEALIMDFVETNVADLNELSLRTVLKIADLARGHPTGWRELAVHTVMRPEAKWNFWKAKTQLKEETA